MRPGTVNRKRAARVYHWLERLLAPVLGSSCQLCLAPGATGLDLCAGCRGDLPWTGAACPRCTRPLGRIATCGACQRRAPPVAGARAAFHYRDEVAALVQAFKFRGDLAAGRLLGDLLAQRWDASLPAVLVPMPLHPRRQRERGFNQATELARRLPGEIHPDLVRRVRATPAQTKLGRAARRANVRDAFALTGRPLPPRLTVVDDVITTGASVHALTRVLRTAGVSEIHVIAVARAPLGGR